MTHKKELVSVIGTIIFACFLGYMAGKRDSVEEQQTAIDIAVTKQKAVDSTETHRYKQLLDSSLVENRVWEKAYNSITTFKAKTKTEINANDKKIGSLVGDGVQRYVDSLRTASGLN